jgi:hypothetical protein
MGYYKNKGPTSDKLLTAIVQDIDAGGVRHGRKYHKIRDTAQHRAIFNTRAKAKFPRAFMVIYYNQDRSEAYRDKL